MTANPPCPPHDHPKALVDPIGLSGSWTSELGPCRTCGKPAASRNPDGGDYVGPHADLLAGHVAEHAKDCIIPDVHDPTASKCLADLNSVARLIPEAVEATMVRDGYAPPVVKCAHNAAGDRCAECDWVHMRDRANRAEAELARVSAERQNSIDAHTRTLLRASQISGEMRAELAEVRRVVREFVHATGEEAMGAAYVELASTPHHWQALCRVAGEDTNTEVAMP